MSKYEGGINKTYIKKEVPTYEFIIGKALYVFTLKYVKQEE